MGSDTSKIDKTGWIKLAPYNSPFPSSSAFSLNKKEFIILDRSCHDHGFSAQKYKIDENKWEKFQLNIFEDYGFQDTYISSTAYDNKRKLLYICCLKFKFIVIFNMKTNDYRIHKPLAYHAPSDGQTIIINKQLHSFGEKHSWLNEVNSQWVRLPNCPVSYVCHAIYLKRRKKVLILRPDRYIKLYDNDKDEWITEQVRFPSGIWNRSCVAVNNDNYVIMAGGTKGKSTNTNAIFVLDLNEMVIMKSKVKCPKKGMFDGVVMNGDFRLLDMLVYGYLREEPGFVGALVEIVVGYIDLKDLCGMEYLHLVNEKGMHWKILVAKILSDMKDI